MLVKLCILLKPPPSPHPLSDLPHLPASLSPIFRALSLPTHPISYLVLASTNHIGDRKASVFDLWPLIGWLHTLELLDCCKVGLGKKRESAFREKRVECWLEWAGSEGGGRKEVISSITTFISHSVWSCPNLTSPKLSHSRLGCSAFASSLIFPRVCALQTHIYFLLVLCVIVVFEPQVLLRYLLWSAAAYAQD